MKKYRNVVLSVFLIGLSGILLLSSCGKKSSVGEEDSSVETEVTKSNITQHYTADTESDSNVSVTSAEGNSLNEPVVTVQLEQRINLCWVCEPRVTQYSEFTNGLEETLTDVYAGLIYVAPQGGSLITVDSIRDRIQVSNTELLRVTGVIADSYNPDGVFVSVLFRPSGLLSNCELSITDDGGHLEKITMSKTSEQDLAPLYMKEIEVEGNYLCLYNPVILKDVEYGPFTYEHVVEYNTFAVGSRTSNEGAFMDDIFSTDEWVYVTGTGLLGLGADNGVCQFAYCSADLKCSENAVPFTLTLNGVTKKATFDFKTLIDKIPATARR